MTSVLPLLYMKIISALKIIHTFHSHCTGDSVVLLNEKSGVFQSPGYPDLDDDMFCTWNIVAPVNHKITLEFLDFDLEDQPICTDEMEVVKFLKSSRHVKTKARLHTLQGLEPEPTDKQYWSSSKIKRLLKRTRGLFCTIRSWS